MASSSRFIVALIALTLLACADSAEEYTRVAGQAWGGPCTLAGGGVIGTRQGPIVFGAEGDATSSDVEFVVVGRGIPDENPDPRPPAFQIPGRRGITGGSMGRWSVGVDTDGTLWLHDTPHPAGDANVFLVEPAPEPETGLVLVEALTRDLGFEVEPCGGLDALMNALNRDEVIVGFVGGALTPW